MNNDPDGGRFGPPQYGNPNINEFNQLNMSTNLPLFYGDVAGVTGGALNNGMGLYYNDPFAYWEAYYTSGGTFGGESVYHRSKGSGDPTTGTNILQNRVGLPTIDGNTLTYSYRRYYGTTISGYANTEGFDILTGSIDLNGDNPNSLGNPFDVSYHAGYTKKIVYFMGIPILLPSSGAQLKIGFTAPNSYKRHFKSFAWIQAYQYTYNDMKWVTDGTTPPFYNSPTDPTTTGSYDLFFMDFANSVVPIVWHAQLVLVGQDADGKYTVLAIFNWGYTNTVGGGSPPQLDPFGSGPNQTLNHYTQSLINLLGQ